MKPQVILPLLIAISVIALGVMKIRKKEHDKENRSSWFQEIKLRVTNDVLSDYLTEKAGKQNKLETAEGELKTLEEELKQLETKAEAAKKEVDTCLSSKNSEKEVHDLAEKELNDVKANTEKESAGWKTETETLQKQLAAQSEVCKFLKPDAQAARQLCGDDAVPKPEEAKPEAPKPEAPKAEEAKAEAPKPEEPKAEAPKPEEPKAEAPKPEEPKAEAPKPEEAKAEAPKPEEAKAEAPKPEEPKVEAPKPEEPKAEAPKPEEAKAEAPKNR
ncbi:neurofilament heavy polypeptide-like isoform X2 [Xyrichtys novacula]|uniref:Neurofilament heavy polypeptide-like isoform X2 n=1 Tax=Xyrichtys novacula TaxID=13765 RepID=A0AAV1FP86_XYRNO|nr:neurofilament heavy polypeptide-like isoform X2 [Xyrichtys novacula]